MAVLWESRERKLCTCQSRRIFCWHYHNKCLWLASEKFVLASKSNLSLATGLASWKVSIEPWSSKWNLYFCFLILFCGWSVEGSVGSPWTQSIVGVCGSGVSVFGLPHSVTDSLRLSFHLFVYFQIFEGECLKWKLNVIASACIAYCLFFDCVKVQNNWTILNIREALRICSWDRAKLVCCLWEFLLYMYFTDSKWSLGLKKQENVTVLLVILCAWKLKSVSLGNLRLQHTESGHLCGKRLQLEYNIWCEASYICRVNMKLEVFNINKNIKWNRCPD